MESMKNYVNEKLKKLGAEGLMDNAPVKLKGIRAVTGLMTNFQEKIKKTGAESMMQMKLKGLGAVSVMKNVQEKLNKTADQYQVVNYMKKKFGWDLKNMTDNVKLKGLGAVSLVKNVQEKLNKSAGQYQVVNYMKKKFDWDLKNMIDNVKLKGLGAVSLMKNVQEKLNKYEVVNYMKKKLGWDLKNMTDDVKSEGLGAVSLTKDVQEKLNKSADQYQVLNYTKQSGLGVDTEFIIIVMAVLVMIVFLLGCIHCFCRGKAGKKMKAPGRKRTRISRPMEKCYEIEANITNRCHLKMIQIIYEALNPEHQIELENSSFGPLVQLRPIKLTSQIVHQLLLRTVITNRKMEAWFKVGGKRLRFGLQEFTLVTGLPAGNFEEVDMSLGEDSRLVKLYFSRCKGRICKDDVLAAFNKLKRRNPTDKYKLGLIIILAYVILSAELSKMIDLWWFELVDDLDRFFKYPWGKLSFEATLSVFKCDKLLTLEVDGVDKCCYTLYGFPLAIMIWAFEAIPGFGAKFAEKQSNSIPRMTGWKMKRLLSSPIIVVLETSDLEVVSTLTPTENEAKEAYWKDLILYADEEDEPLHHSEGEDDEPEGGDEAGPSQVPPEMIDPRVAELVRLELEKMEGRIQNKLDGIEAKLDKLVEFVTSAKSQSTTSLPVDEPEVGDQFESKNDEGEKVEEARDNVVDNDESGDGNLGTDHAMKTRVEAIQKMIAGVDLEGDLLHEEFLTSIKLDDATYATTGGT